MPRKKKERDQWWRPTKISDDIVWKLIEAFKSDSTVEEACSYAGIAKDTFYRRYKKYKWFSDKIEDAKKYPFFHSKFRYFEAIDSADPNVFGKYALEFLKRRHPDWKDKQENTLDYAFTSITIEDATWEESRDKTNPKAAGTSDEIPG